MLILFSPIIFILSLFIYLSYKSKQSKENYYYISIVGIILGVIGIFLLPTQINEEKNVFPIKMEEKVEYPNEIDEPIDWDNMQKRRLKESERRSRKYR